MQVFLCFSKMKDNCKLCRTTEYPVGRDPKGSSSPTPCSLHDYLTPNHMTTMVVTVRAANTNYRNTD